MPSAIESRYSCNPQVKTLWPNHKTCEKTKKGGCVSGKRLNLYHNVREFDESLNYVVCSNIYKKTKDIAYTASKSKCRNLQEEVGEPLD